MFRISPQSANKTGHRGDRVSTGADVRRGVGEGGGGEPGERNVFAAACRERAAREVMRDG
jgi:hypothetical protein